MIRPASTVILCYPPASSIWHLPMGMAYLASILQQRGHHVIQEYGHINGVEHLLRRNGGPSIGHHLQAIRDPESSVLDRYDARLAIEDSSRMDTELESFVVQRNNVLYDSKRFKGHTDDLKWVLHHREEHIFYEYLSTVELPRIVRAAPDFVGISIADERQLVCGCVLASLIKEALPGVPVVMGGNYWARVLDAYLDDAFVALFDLWDAIVYGEGFVPVVRLVEGAHPSTVPAIVWRDGATVRINPRIDDPIAFEDLPTPVFNRQTTQWSPDFVPPLYTMSNCPMRCSFCSIAAGSDSFLSRPRMMSPKRIVDHMAAIGAKRFDFVDEYLPIARQLEVGSQLRDRGYKATWQCYLTVNDRLLDPQVCEALAEAGCRGVQMGLESLHPDILKQEAKPWNHPRNYGRILKNLHEVGIQTHVFIIVGCPNEPINWSLRWLSFLEQYGQYILTIKSGRYRLTRRSPDEKLARVGALDGVQSSETDNLLLNLNRDQFTYTNNGLSRKRVEAIRDLLEEGCRQHWAYQITSTLHWWTNRGRHTLAELRAMADALAAERPPESSLPESQMKRALIKVASAVRSELNIAAVFRSYEDARRTADELTDRQQSVLGEP